MGPLLPSSPCGLARNSRTKQHVFCRCSEASATCVSPAVIATAAATLLLTLALLLLPLLLTKDKSVTEGVGSDLREEEDEEEESGEGGESITSSIFVSCTKEQSHRIAL